MADAGMERRALEFLLRMARVPSVTRTVGEVRLAELIHDILGEIGRGQLERGLYPVPDDPLGTSVAWGFLRGASSRTTVLMCHFDTVDTSDYGSLAAYAHEPEELRSALLGAEAALSVLAREHLRSDEWLFGRGTVDMKSGVAAHLAVLEEMCAAAAAGAPPPGNVIFLATPDEEMESAGILAAVELLLRLRTERGLTYTGAINTDYTAPRFDGDASHSVYIGTVGKLLPAVYVRGVESHAGDPFSGVDANLLLAEVIRAVSMNVGVADTGGEVPAVPPVTLHAADLKSRYDVQLPFEGYAYFNYLTTTASPEQVLGRILTATRGALASAAAAVHANRAEWAQRVGVQPAGAVPEPTVVSYSELYRRAVEAVSEAAAAAIVDRACSTASDAREASVAVVRALWSAAGLARPGAVCFFCPPYYPHSAGPRSGPLVRAAEALGDAGLTVRRFYPHITDASYLGLDADASQESLCENMPGWSDSPRPHRYSLPLGSIRDLGVPVANVGVWGFGAHTREERVHIPYSCGVVPRLVKRMVYAMLEDEDE